MCGGGDSWNCFRLPIACSCVPVESLGDEKVNNSRFIPLPETPHVQNRALQSIGMSKRPKHQANAPIEPIIDLTRISPFRTSHQQPIPQKPHIQKHSITIPWHPIYTMPYHTITAPTIPVSLLHRAQPSLSICLSVGMSVLSVCISAHVLSPKITPAAKQPSVP